MSTSFPSGRAFTALLGVAAGVQVAAAAIAFGPALGRVPGDFRLLTADLTAPAPTEGMAAYLALPALLRQVPLDAPVLVVSGLAAVQFEYYVLPRPLRLLQALPQAWVDLARQYAPDLADEVERRRQRLDDRGLLLTEARLVAAIDHVRYVVVAGPEPAALAAVRARLEPVRAKLGFALYVVRG